MRRSIHGWVMVIGAIALSLFLPHALPAIASDEPPPLRLSDLISEVDKNPEILISRYRAEAAGYRISQATTLPDPMVMLGYQNEKYGEITYGEMPDSQIMYGVSQMFPYPGKLALQGEMARREAESLEEATGVVRLKTIALIKKLYQDLFLAHKDIMIIDDLASLFSRVEDAALARYASGMASQQEVVMAQTEKYMLLERRDMLLQRIESLEAMLNAALGRDAGSPLGKPVETASGSIAYTMEEMVRMAGEASPDLAAESRMIAAAEAKVAMAKREYYPDITVAGTISQRGGGLDDMWALTATVNVPIFYKTKQRLAVSESEASLAETRQRLEVARLMISSGVRDNLSMVKTSEGLMRLYRDGLIPKAYQDFELALSGYVTGKVEAITAVTRLKAVVDLETLYWARFAEREKAVAEIEAITGRSVTAATITGDEGNGK